MNDQQNGINDFFRTRLGDQTPAENQWNVPSDDVFLGAMNAVDAKFHNSNNRKYSKYFLLLLLLVCGGGAFWGAKHISLMYDKVSQLENTLAILESQELNHTARSSFPKDKKSALKPIEIHPPEIETVLSKKVFLSKKSVIPSSHQKSNDIIAPENSHLKKTAYSNDKIPPTKKAISSESRLGQTNKTGFEAEPKLEKVLPPLKGSLINALIIAPIQLSFEIKREDQKKKVNPLSIGLFASSNWSTVSMSNVVLAENSILQNYDKLYSGYGIGSHILYETSSHWTLKASVSYNKLENQSHYYQEMHFDQNKLISLNDGTLAYPLAFDIMTPMGRFATQSSFKVADQTVKHNDLMMNDWYIHQRLTITNLSLGARFNLNPTPKTKLFVGTDITANQINKANHNLHTTIITDDTKLMDMTANDAKMNNTKSTYISLSGEFGLQYQLGKNINLELSGSYNAGVSSLLSRVNTDDPKTYLNLFNSNIGLNYNF